MGQVRDIIETEFQTRQKKNPQYSLRAFARRLDISPAQLSQILSGKRPITLKFVKKVASKLDYSPREAQALIDRFIRDKGEKPEPVEMNRIKIQEDHFRLISDWYHFAILSLTRLRDAKADPRWIAQQLAITVTEASQALSRLERLNLISTQPTFKQIGNPLEIISETPSEAIRKYHKQNLLLAADKLDDIPNHLREFQSMTIPVHLIQLTKYRKIIDQLLDLASEISDDKNATQVYNLNIQFFPLTQAKENT